MSKGRQGKATVGVLTVIDEELEAVRKAVGAQHRKNRFYYTDDDEHGSSSRKVVVAKMGDRTNVPATEATNHLIEQWRPDYILLVGIAGALDSGDACLGDVVVVDYIHYGEFRKLTEGHDDLRFAAYDHPTVNVRMDVVEGVAKEPEWIKRIRTKRPKKHRGSDPKSVIGALVAGEKVVGDPDNPEQQRLFLTFENAQAVDMESWGVGRAVHHARCDPDYNPRLVVIRGISDMIERESIEPKKPESQPAAIADSPLQEQPATPTPVLDSGDAAAPPISATTETVHIVNGNNEQRKLWKKYAAAAAAALAAEVIREILDD